MFVSKEKKNTLRFQLSPEIAIRSNLADLIFGNLRSVTSFTRCYLDKMHLFPFFFKLYYFFRKRTGHPLKQRQRETSFAGRECFSLRGELKLEKRGKLLKARMPFFTSEQTQSVCESFSSPHIRDAKPN